MDFTLDLTYLNEISGEDKEFIQEILHTFLEEMPKDIKEMSSALNENNNVLIGKMAHKTKATLQLLGLSELKELALDIEQTTKTDSNNPQIQTWTKEFINHMDKVYPNVKAML
jgi:HPt (histidine-containing phosphotransfer) domain-containing protein